METRWQLPLLGWDTITLAAVSTALSFYLATRDRSGLPGPVALPILGNIPGILLSGSIDIYMDEMREQYGDVSTSQDTVLMLWGMDIIYRVSVCSLM